MKITTFMKIIVFTAFIESEWINYARLIAKKCLLFSKLPPPTFWTPKLFRNSKSKLLYLRKPLNMILLFWKGATLPQKPTSWKFCFEKHCWSSVFFCVGDLLKERSQHFLGIGSWAQSVWTHRIQSVHSFSHFSRIFLLVRPTKVRGLGAPHTFDSF